jgi:hypothetical protein
MTSSFTAKNVTFRTYTAHAELVEQAAEKAGKTLSEYCRDVMIPYAAKDLGVPVPSLPDMKRGRFTEIVTEAAKITGLTPEEFMRQASERLAAAALGYQHDVGDRSVPLNTPKGLQPRTPQTSRQTPAPRKRRIG